jgi:adhesin transport system outer membrane protein
MPKELRLLSLRYESDFGGRFSNRTRRFDWLFVCALILALLLGVFSVARATNAPSEQMLPLATVLEIVTDTNPEITEALMAYQSIKAERSIATSDYWPKIGTELSGGRQVTNGAESDDEREHLTAKSASVYVRQNLYRGGKTTAHVNETDARILAAAYEVLNVANRVYLETAEAYIAVIEARELLELSEENVLIQEKILEQVREKSAAGFSRASDLKNSEARLALARGNYISRQQDLNQAVVQFHRQFGRLVRPEVLVRPKPRFKFPESVEETVAVALRNHPALEVAKYNIQVRKYSFEKAKADDWPTLDLEVKAQRRSDYNGEPGDDDQFSALLTLNYVLFDGGLRRGEKAKNYNSIRRENQRAYVERRNVNETVRLAWNIMQAEERKWKYINEHVLLSADTLEAFKEEYFIGRRTLLDLLNMENEYNAAKNARTVSSFSHLASYYQLSQGTGMMLQEYDAGLRARMGLPPNQVYDLEGYDDLESNKDFDSIEDIDDQCDNSIEGSLTQPSGCVEEKAIRVGYEEPTELSPYILPKEDTPAELTLKIDKVKRHQSFHLDAILFNTGSAELTQDSRKKLIYIAEQLNAAEGFTIEVIGHTDNTASEHFNQQLSEARAQSVFDELVRLGLPREKLTISGKGETEPIATNVTEDGRRKNRRIEIKLIKKLPDQ